MLHLDYVGKYLKMLYIYLYDIAWGFPMDVAMLDMSNGKHRFSHEWLPVVCFP